MNRKCVRRKPKFFFNPVLHWVLVYLLAEILCLYCQRRSGTDSALLLGYSFVDAVGRPEVLRGEELHYQLRVLLALCVSQTAQGPLHGLLPLLHI